MLTLAAYSKLTRNPAGGGTYELTAVVTGASGVVTYAWRSTDINRPPLSGNPVFRKFSGAAKQWSETVTVTDATGQTAAATLFLDLVTDSPIPPPPPVNPTIAVDAAAEAKLLAVPQGGTIDLVGPAYITTLTRS